MRLPPLRKTLPVNDVAFNGFLLSFKIPRILPPAKATATKAPPATPKEKGVMISSTFKVTAVLPIFKPPEGFFSMYKDLMLSL